MKLEFPKIVRSFPLSEYAPEVRGEIQVWVNPPVKTLSDLGEAFKRYSETHGQDGQELFLTILSTILSAGPDAATHWSADELKDVYERSADTDPAFWMWLQNRILKEIAEHRNGLKKA